MPLPFQPKINPIAAEIEKRKLEQSAAQKREELKQLSADNDREISGSGQDNQLVKYISPDQVKDRIKIIFDDSSSMSYGKMDDAIQGCIEFLRNCGFNQTAAAIIPLNSNLFEMKALTTDLPSLAAKVKMLRACGGTPLYSKWVTTLADNVTRFVIFSDGQPDMYGDEARAKEVAIGFAVDKKIPCDTILIWESSYPPEGTPEYRELKEIADKTNGIFMVFDRKKVNFKTAFKYLAPVHRLALVADVGMQKDLQEGKLK